MSVLLQLGLGKRAANSDEDERVLELFRNRAELKKAYSELQDEVHHLKERLRQQEIVTARVQEMHSSLESKLEDRTQGYSSMVFFQLRRLWRVGHDVLAALASDLEAQQLERERRAFVADLNRQQFARRQQIDTQVVIAQGEAVAAHRELQEAEQQIAQLQRPWHRTARKEQELRIQRLREVAAEKDLVLQNAREQRDQLHSDSDRAFPGLSLEARRHINLAAIACAENLHERLAKSPLLALARAAAARRAPSESYGNRDECEALMADIALAQAVLAQRGKLTTEIKARVDALKRSVVYENDESSIPAADSLFGSSDAREDKAATDNSNTGASDVFAVLEPPRPSAPFVIQPVNVLIDDSWEIMRVLIR